MPRDLGSAIEESDRVIVGDESEITPSMQRGNGVAIGVDADERRLVHGHGRDGVGLGERVGQSEQTRPLLVEHVGDAHDHRAEVQLAAADVFGIAAQILLQMVLEGHNGRQGGHFRRLARHARDSKST